MSSRSINTARPVLSAAAIKIFLRRRTVEIGGIALLVLGLGLGAALVSYSPADPSLNLNTAANPSNWLGRPGALVADLALQTLGLAGVLPMLVLAAWGWRLVTHRGLPWWWLNLALVPVSLTLAAIGAAGWPAGPSWPLHSGLGGVIGRVLLQDHVLAVWRWLGFAGDIVWPALSAGLVGLVAFIFALGLTRREWYGFGRVSARALGLLALGLYRGGRAIGEARGGGWREPSLAADKRGSETPLAPRLKPPGTAASPRVERPRVVKRARGQQQSAFDLARSGEFSLPSLKLLDQPSINSRVETINEDALEQNARLLESVLLEFGVSGEIVKVRPGPVVTLYELEPAPGTKSSRVVGLADDIARSMSALSARIAIIPGRNAIGIELPNAKRETVYLRELLSAPEYESNQAKLCLALGKDISGMPVIADLSRMPHLLVAGTTGSGKSVAINTMILSLLYRLSPDQCRFIMIDPKMLELSVYDGIPHLLAPVVTDPGKAVVALKWTVREMEERYRQMSELGVRNIAGYNQRLSEARARDEKLSRTVQTGFDATTGQPIFEERRLELDPLPLIVVVVDELADLMMVAGKDIEAAMQRLAQMARAAGIYLIVATQRPSVDVITGTIKANFPTRISFQVTSKIDSRTILGEQGAEQLLGMGDMLFMPSAGRITRVHGPFVSDDEVEAVVAFLKSQGEPEFIDAVTADPEARLPGLASGFDDEDNALYDQAVALVCRERKASTSFIQRYLQIGYNRAARIIERMEAEGVVGPANHVGKRDVLAGDGDDRER